METTLKFILYIVALVALITGLNVLVGGAAAIPGSVGPVEATVDNELRFFSVYWIGFGVFCFWVGRNLQEQYFLVPYIALLFLLSGVARLVSVFAIGSPSDVLVHAMVLEFILPVVLFVLYVKTKSGRPVHA